MAIGRARTKCGHELHKACITTNAKSKSSCPTCKVVCFEKAQVTSVMPAAIRVTKLAGQIYLVGPAKQALKQTDERYAKRYKIGSSAIVPWTIRREGATRWQLFQARMGEEWWNLRTGRQKLAQGLRIQQSSSGSRQRFKVEVGPRIFEWWNRVNQSGETGEVKEWLLITGIAEERVTGTMTAREIEKISVAGVVYQMFTSHRSRNV